MGGGQQCLPDQGGRGGLQLRLGAMPFKGPVRAPAPSSGGGGGGTAGPGAVVLPHGGSQGPGAGPWEGFGGGHFARGGSPSAAPRHTGGPGVG